MASVELSSLCPLTVPLLQSPDLDGREGKNPNPAGISSWESKKSNGKEKHIKNTTQI